MIKSPPSRGSAAQATTHSSASTSTASGAALPPAQLAKAALKRLAEQRLEPTPENYRRAYEVESGIDSTAAEKTAASEETSSPQADEGERWAGLITRIIRGAERGSRQWTTGRKKDSLQRVLEGSKSSAQRLHQRLSQLVSSWDDAPDSNLVENQGEASMDAEASSVEPNAATATTDSHVSPSVTDATAAPLTAQATATSDVDLVSPTAHAASGIEVNNVASHAWPPMALHAVDALAHTVTAALPAAQAPSLEASEALTKALAQGRDADLPFDQHAQAKQEITQACEQVRRVIEHRHHLIDQLTDLCQSLTDSMVDLSEDDSWVQGQCATMRHQLSEGLHSRGVRHVQQVLADTRARQRELKQERATARQALKQLINQMLQEIAELGSTTDRFHSKLGAYTETIGEAESLESLAGVVREMVEESRAVQTVVAQTQSRLNDEHQRASQLSDRVRALEDEIRKLSDEVSTDPLTQIANRRGMMRAFEIEQAKVQRGGTLLSIGLLDVDNFKKLNDSLGHQTGDEALKFLARRVGECLRPVDVVARYGGEEFVVMLPDIDADAAQQVLTRLQRTLSAEFFTHEDKKVFITFSAGVTLYRADEAIEAALDRADVALYEAKRTGKNRTCIG